MLMLCCAREQMAIVRLIKPLPKVVLLPIDKLGKFEKPGKKKGVLFYYAEVQFSGNMEPFSGKKGLDLIPNCIVYSSLVANFAVSFSHYRDHLDLQTYAAIFMEEGATISITDEDFMVGGIGSVTLIRKKSFKANGQEFKLNQYAPGENFRVPSFIKA